MKKITLTALFATMALSACGTASDGGVAVETRDVPGFSSITLDGVSVVRIHRGPQAIRVTVDAGLIDRYETRVQGGTLRLGFKGGLDTWWASRNLKTCEVDVTVAELRGIVLNGSGKMTVDEFAYKKLDLKLNGSGTIGLEGTADELAVSCNGDGRVLARDLAAKAGIVALNGSGRVELNVEDSLAASITGSGELVYRGNPEVSQKIAGAGSLRRTEE